MIIKKNERMIEARFRLRKSQIALALETGFHYSMISRIECGYIKPTEEQKEKLAKALGVQTDWLFSEKKSF